MTDNQDYPVHTHSIYASDDFYIYLSIRSVVVGRIIDCANIYKREEVVKSKIQEGTGDAKHYEACCKLQYIYKREAANIASAWRRLTGENLQQFLDEQLGEQMSTEQTADEKGA